MRVLLINPNRNFNKGNIWKLIKRSIMPMGLGYIAACLEKEQIEVKAMDLQAEVSSREELINTAKGFMPDYIGLTSTTTEIQSACDIAGLLKQSLPNAKTVMGGAHPTIMPEEVLRNEFVDYVVRGEGEKTFTELVLGKEDVSIKGLSYKDNGRIINNPTREPIDDIDSIPFPAYHLFPMKKYIPSLGNYKRLPAASLITTRGCPGRCTFCYRFFGKKIKTRSARNIADEMKLLKRNHGIREITFYDDTFTVYKENVKELCRILIEEKINITWSCMSRMDCVNKEVLELMKKAGCHQIGYGIESADEDILKRMQKFIPSQKVREVVDVTKKTGIDVRGMFMFGSPGETPQTLEKTLRFALELNLDIALFNITTPYPGTAMFKWAKDTGVLKTEDWSLYHAAYPVMNLAGLDTETLMSYYKKAYRRFYMRPSYLLRRFLKIRSREELKASASTFLKLTGFVK